MRAQLQTLGEEFEGSWKYLMERTYYILNFGLWDVSALWGQWPHLTILFVWRFMWWDVSVLWGQYLHHRHRVLRIAQYEIPSYRSWGDFGYLCEDDIVRDDFGIHCRLAITVVERLQRYNCIWLTYIDNVEQNILFYIEVWSCEMLSLCGKLIWRRNVVFWLHFVFRRRLYRYPVWITSFLRG